MDYLNDLHEFYRMIMHAMVEAKEQVRATGKLLPKDMEYIDCITHSLKSLKTLIAMEENNDYYSSQDKMNKYIAGMEKELKELKEEIQMLRDKV